MHGRGWLFFGRNRALIRNYCGGFAAVWAELGVIERSVVARCFCGCFSETEGRILEIY